MRDYDWQILVTLHSTQSITKTAELLFISQPALTKRIQAIETELGVPLLIRSRQGSVFTPEGERIAKKAERIVSAINDAKSEAASGKGIPEKLRIGVPYSFVRYALPNILTLFTKRYPDVDIDIVTLPSHEVVKCVEDSTLDLCFARYGAEDSALERIPFCEGQAAIVYNRPFTLDELPDIPFIEFPKNPGSASAIERWWNERFDREMKVRYKVATADACVSMAEHGLGCCIVLDSKYLERMNNIYYMPMTFLDGTKLTRKTWIFFRKDTGSRAIIQDFISCALEIPKDDLQWM